MTLATVALPTASRLPRSGHEGLGSEILLPPHASMSCPGRAATRRGFFFPRPRRYPNSSRAYDAAPPRMMADQATSATNRQISAVIDRRLQSWCRRTTPSLLRMQTYIVLACRSMPQ